MCPSFISSSLKTGIQRNSTNVRTNEKLDGDNLAELSLLNDLELDSLIAVGPLG